MGKIRGAERPGGDTPEHPPMAGEAYEDVIMMCIDGVVTRVRVPCGAECVVVK